MNNESAEQPIIPEQLKLKDLGNFEIEPDYAYLWDRCVYELLYKPQEYVKELSGLLEQYGITKDSKVLDTSAGSGFPALDMVELGYQNITCVDGSDDQIELFNEKSKAKGFEVRSGKCLWKDLPKHYSEGQFDALLCKGSIWYAGGGWNKDALPERESSIRALRETLGIFYSLLNKGGVLYLDKFKDDEVDHKDPVGTFEVQGKQKELLFYTHREKEIGVRRAKMLIKDVETGVEEGLPNVTYDLKSEELEEVLREVGFSIIKPDMSEEKFFDVWLAIKNR